MNSLLYSIRKEIIDSTVEDLSYDNYLAAKFSEVNNAIQNSEHILVVGHRGPDGDSIGSTIGLGNAIEKNTDKSVELYSYDGVPKPFQFLQGSDRVKTYIEWYPDIIMGVDYGDFERLCLPDSIAQGVQLITFDHHPHEKQRGDISVVDTSYSSTAELVYSFIRYQQWDIYPDIATALATGIMHDTEGFAHKTSSHVFTAMGDLLEKGASLSDVYEHSVYSADPLTLNIWGDVIQNSIVNHNYGYVGVFVPFKKIQEYGIVSDVLDKLKEILKTVYDVKFAVLVVEYERDKIKGSFRSDKFRDVDVSEMAKKLGGGGHKYAAGFRLECSLKEAKIKIEKAIEESLLV